MKYSYIKTATASPTLSVGDCFGNADNIACIINELAQKDVELVLFPELSLTSSSCGDLFTLPAFIQQCAKALERVIEATRGKNIIAVAGAPVANNNSLYNCSIAIHNGRICGIVPKAQLNNSTSNESRWFTAGIAKAEIIEVAGQKVPFGSNLLFTTQEYSFGIETGTEANAPLSPGALLAAEGATIILNPSAEATIAGSHKATKARIENKSAICKCGYMHANCGWGESTSNAAYAGYCAIAECGDILAQTGQFNTAGHYTVSEIDTEKIQKQRIADNNFGCKGYATVIDIPQIHSENCEITRNINANPFVPCDDCAKERLEEVFNIQANALARRIVHIHANTCVIGISGGLDSTLALLVTAKACDICGKPHSDIVAITMPGFGTTERTHTNAHTLMERLGVTIMEISIKEACLQHFKDIDHNIENHDITYENSQARERTQILMDIANQRNGIVIGTGDLSELALGWATYNGDHMSMYSVNASVPKTLIRHIVNWYAQECGDKTVASTLTDILDTPISPELVPANENGEIKQKTEDLVGPYELHDFFIYNFVHNGYAPEKIYFLAQQAFKDEYSNEVIKKWLATFMRRFFIQQFKRSCSPDGPVTGVCNLNPHIGWIMPSDTSGREWTDIISKLK